MNQEIIQLIYPWDQQQHHEHCGNPWCRYQHTEEWLLDIIEDEYLVERCPLRNECPAPDNCNFFHPMWEIEYNHPQTFARYLSLPYVKKKKTEVECQFLSQRLRQIGLADWKESTHLYSLVQRVYKLFGGDVHEVADASTAAASAVAGQGISTVCIAGAREAVRVAVGDAKALEVEEVATGICAVLEPELLALPHQLGITGKMMYALDAGVDSLAGGQTVEASVATALALVGGH
jgi:hypothetical protein